MNNISDYNDQNPAHISPNKDLHTKLIQQKIAEIQELQKQGYKKNNPCNCGKKNKI